MLVIKVYSYYDSFRIVLTHSVCEEMDWEEEEGGEWEQGGEEMEEEEEEGEHSAAMVRPQN